MKALNILRSKLIIAIASLASFAKEHANLPAFSLYPPPSSSADNGRQAHLFFRYRIFSYDLQDLNYYLLNFRFLRAKGATGTQASFLSLFDNDHQKVKDLDIYIAKEMGFTHLLRNRKPDLYPKRDIRRFFPY